MSNKHVRSSITLWYIFLLLEDLLFVCMLVCVLAMTVFHIDTEVKKTQSPTITRYTQAEVESNSVQ